MIHDLSFIHFLGSSQSTCSSLCTFLGFAAFLSGLLAVLKWGPRYRKPPIITVDSPRLWATGPLFAEKRRRAAAAALALHHHHTSTGPTL